MSAEHRVRVVVHRPMADKIDKDKLSPVSKAIRTGLEVAGTVAAVGEAAYQGYSVATTGKLSSDLLPNFGGKAKVSEAGPSIQTPTPEGKINIPTATGTLEVTPTPPFGTQTETPVPTGTEPATETAPATATEAFQPVDLGTEKVHAKCNGPEDFAAGSPRFLTEQEALKKIQIPEGANIKGYETDTPGGSDGWWIIYPSKGSTGVAGEPISFCDMQGDIINLPGRKFTVLGIPWLNKDETLSVVHIFVDESTPKFSSEAFVNGIEKSNGTALAITQYVAPGYIKKYQNTPHYEYYSRLYAAEGQDKIFQLVKQLSDTGNVPEELQHELLIGSLLSGFY